jgi:LAO/AO transport system kinase
MTKPDSLSVGDYVKGILAHDRIVLAQAITLIESQARRHEAPAQEVLRQILPLTGTARRVGISGSPGVGKSTFIEALGLYLIKKGHKLAVLTIDPSSIISGGSILGDKTRMEGLSREPNAFIRPSPTAGNPGGVARCTREAMLLCEVAGFDIIIVESVGVGQSEVTLRSMVDYLLLLLLPGAGDELQGIKKGIVEIADDILINKADGENKLAAEQARLYQQSALGCFMPVTEGWTPDASLCSAITGQGVAEAWQRVETFYSELEPKGVVAARRRKQMLDWLGDIIRDMLLRDFYHDPAVEKAWPAVRKAVLAGEKTAVQAANGLLAIHHDNLNSEKL